MADEVTFADGKGPLSKSTPAGFPSDWHFERHLEDLERELAGRLHRKAELEAMESVQQKVLDEVDAEIAAVREKLTSFGRHPGAAKRPAATGNKRTTTKPKTKTKSASKKKA